MGLRLNRCNDRRRDPRRVAPLPIDTSLALLYKTLQKLEGKLRRETDAGKVPEDAAYDMFPKT